ncbi:transmembrane protein 182-like [Archocentrus centrarchus]|uniref:transmembrane protein 182-like n=1 Tax=Archocentrus centrarchus TaxID=63155 RepID=UPI0011E9C042|nr:transmembrane protein 182-like [Archocentrus centrarchus]
MSSSKRMKVLLFFALFFGATGFLFLILSCGTEYWLLAAESCSNPGETHGDRNLREMKTSAGVTIFHEGLFWRCSYITFSHDYSIWDLWISNQPLPKVCQAAFLFPFPSNKPVEQWEELRSFPIEPYDRNSATVFRICWTIFFVTGLAAVIIGGFVVICAGPLTNHKLYKVGGALQVLGGVCLLTTVMMYIMWIQVLDTLDQFTQHQKASRCSSFRLSIQHGPSFFLAPVAVFFSLLAGLLFILVGRSIESVEVDSMDKISDTSTAEL